MTANEEWTDVPAREKRLIGDVVRYFLTTARIARRRIFTELSEDAVRKILAREAEKDWLSRHALSGQESYFMLSQKSLTALNLRRSTKPFGHQALLEHYAVLLACAKRGCDVFTEDEFRSRFPDLAQPGFSAKNFFMDSAGGVIRLGCFVVDHDKLTSRIVKKLGKRVSKMMETDRPKLRQHVLSGQFAFHIITATEGKRANLQAAFARKPLEHVPVFVEAYPEDLGNFFLLKRR